MRAGAQLYAHNADLHAHRIDLILHYPDFLILLIVTLHQTIDLGLYHIHSSPDADARSDKRNCANTYEVKGHISKPFA